MLRFIAANGTSPVEQARELAQAVLSSEVFRLAARVLEQPDSASAASQLACALLDATEDEREAEHG